MCVWGGGGGSVPRRTRGRAQRGKRQQQQSRVKDIPRERDVAWEEPPSQRPNARRTLAGIPNIGTKACEHPENISLSAGSGIKGELNNMEEARMAL